jgi:hypothetical protein
MYVAMVTSLLIERGTVRYSICLARKYLVSLKKHSILVCLTIMMNKFFLLHWHLGLGYRLPLVKIKSVL